MARDVYVIGAGFSAGLGYPLTSELLPFALKAMSAANRERLLKIVRFHFPLFRDSQWRTFPNIEALLTRMEINHTLFHASRRVEGRFKQAHLVAAQRDLLYTIAEKFHGIGETAGGQGWLDLLVNRIQQSGAAVISFNWDLVLDRALSNGPIANNLYSVTQGRRRVPVLLKPHGSLNWYLAEQGQFISSRKREVLWQQDEGQSDHARWSSAFLFTNPRAPKSSVGREYLPWIVPPTYVKSFDHPFLQRTWSACVSVLSRARNVYFLGYSMPTYDFHSEFIFRCGFHNQREGEPHLRRRTQPRRVARVVVVNPDPAVSDRVATVLGVKCHHVPMTAATWVRTKSW